MLELLLYSSRPRVEHKSTHTFVKFADESHNCNCRKHVVQFIVVSLLGPTIVGSESNMDASDGSIRIAVKLSGFFANLRGEGGK